MVTCLNLIIPCLCFSMYLFNLLYKEVPDKTRKNVYFENETVERYQYPTNRGSDLSDKNVAIINLMQNYTVQCAI